MCIRDRVYKARACDFEDTKASVLGDFVPAKLGMDEGENAVYMAVTSDFAGYMLFFFQNGKVAKVNLNSYETKTNRKKLLNAYSMKEPLSAVLCIREEMCIRDRNGVGMMTLMQHDFALVLSEENRTVDRKSVV